MDHKLLNRILGKGIICIIIFYPFISESGVAGGSLRANVILITSDQQQKGSIGVYGNSLINTQALDNLANDGIVFERAYTPHPTCTPARSSILTGQYASTHGAYTIGTALSYKSPKVTEVLTRHDYETYFVGKMHFRQVSAKGEFESVPHILDENFWRNFDGPYFGFQHVRMLNRHTSEELSCREHYGIWLKDKGLTESDLKKYFNNQTGTWNLPLEYHPSRFVSEKATMFIDEHCEKRKDKPFFMWVSFQDPHPPHVVPAPYDTLVSADQIVIKALRKDEFDNKPPVYQELYEKGSKGLNFFDNIGVPCASPVKPELYSRQRASMAIYYGMIKLMDDEIAKIIEKLKNKGLYDNTIIIFTTDHGEYGGNHGFESKGFPAYEEVYNVPFILKNVNSVSRGKRSNALISTLDIAPSVVDLIGLKIPGFMEGVSQKEVFSGRKEQLRPNIVIENRAVQKGFYQKMIVTEQYKLVYYYKQTYGEFYDLRNDPDQYENLWDKTEFKNEKTKLLYQLYLEHSSKKLIDLSKLNVNEVIKLLDKQIDQEGKVQERTSFS
jgi:uncharacterized sulfatase